MVAWAHLVAGGRVPDSGYILKTQSTGFAKGLGIEWRRREESTITQRGRPVKEGGMKWGNQEFSFDPRKFKKPIRSPSSDIKLAVGQKILAF